MAYGAFSALSGMLPPHGNPSVGIAMPPIPSQAGLAGHAALSPNHQHILQQMQQQYHQQFQHLHQFMNPAMNDQPLDFNPNKNKPPMAIINEQPCNGPDSVQNDERERDRDGREKKNGRDRERDRQSRRDQDRERDRGDVSNHGDEEQSVNQPSMATPMPMLSMGGMMGGIMGGMMGPGMMPLMGGMDPASIMGMGQFGMMPNMIPPGADGESMVASESGFVQKTVLEFKECTMTAPSNGARPSLNRDKPPGCRTVYVGGLPENITEEIIRDIFGRCGTMLHVRLSKKNFCHIRYSTEEAVEAALQYSGYRMRIGHKTDPANTGRLHVDYAHARLDQYEYECQQRAMLREQRHRERMERERTKPASPPLIPHYTDNEASTVNDNLKSDEGFQKSAATVIAWLERGDLSKRNANTFYSMIQTTYSHVRRLINEKTQFEGELRAAKDLHRNRIYQILAQFESIEKVFTCASHKKCWDHFSKAQRKNIETWKKQSLEMKTLQLSDSSNEEGDEEMELSDEDDNSISRKRSKLDSSFLKEENEGLKRQLEGYKNEMELVKADFTADLEEKDRHIKMLQQAVENWTNELTVTKKILEDEQALVRDLKAEAEKKVNVNVPECSTPAADEKRNSASLETYPVISDTDARLIGLISTFLNVHPTGAGLDYIWSYLSKLDASVKVQDIEALMARFPSVFRQELVGIGATLERRWIFNGFFNLTR